MNKYWKIEPYHNNEADFCVMPANNDTQHHSALEYATKRLEDEWDAAEVGQKITVSMELREGEMPETIFGDDNE